MNKIPNSEESLKFKSHQKINIKAYFKINLISKSILYKTYNIQMSFKLANC